MPEQTPKVKMSCVKLILWIALLIAVVLLLAFVVIVSLFDLGVWTEFWDEVGKRMGGG